MGRFIGRSEVGEASLATIVAVRPMIERLRWRDDALAQQLVRALTSVAMSAGRVGFARPAERRAHLLSALASASEAAALLQMAVDWRYCDWPDAKPGRDALARTRALLSKQVQQRSRRLTRFAR